MGDKRMEMWKEYEYIRLREQKKCKERKKMEDVETCSMDMLHELTLMQTECKENALNHLIRLHQEELCKYSIYIVYDQKQQQ